MPKFVEYNSAGDILKYGQCSRAAFVAYLRDGRQLLEVAEVTRGMDITDKVRIVGGRPYVQKRDPGDPTIFPGPPVSEPLDENRPATITKKQLSDILARLTNLEGRANANG